MWIDFSALDGALSLLGGSWMAWAVVPLGLMIGLIFGAIPGMQTSMAMAIFLPATLYMDFLSAMLFLTAIFTGGGFGGGISSILIGIPGTSTAVATTFDGYPMTRKGQHNEALGAALFSSCVGMLFSYVILFLTIGFLASFVLNFGPLEMLMVALWGVTLIGILGGKSFSKGLLAGLFGLLLGTIGTSPIGVTRGTFGIPDLLDGIPVVPAMLGLFAVSELISLTQRDYIVGSEDSRRLNFGRIIAGFGMAMRYPGTLLQGSVMGALIGAIPGVGSSVSNLASYAEARRRDPNPESFGQGNPKGVVAAESANSSSEGGSMVTLLALGLPGGGGTAVMLAAFAAHNITGGPKFIRDQTDIVCAIILGNMAQAFLLLLLGLFTIHFISALVKVPIRYLTAAVLVMSVTGAYALTGNMLGPYVLIAFGALGWLMRRFNYSIAAMVVGLLMGSLCDTNLVYVYQISGGDWQYLFERPLALALALLLVVCVAVVPMLRWYRGLSAATAQAGRKPA
ncbi:tripartite tricarboxylate transporter permease [Bosea sp. NPDC055594]